jgi:putative acetyltransferase
MYVRSDLRGRGVGQLLLDACLGAAQALGFAKCYAETIAQMEGALAFYDRNGFIRLDVPSGSTGHAFNDRWLMLHFAASASGGVHC